MIMANKKRIDKRKLKIKIKLKNVNKADKNE
jgi:hypothetical protein